MADALVASWRTGARLYRANVPLNEDPTLSELVRCAVADNDPITGPWYEKEASWPPGWNCLYFLATTRVLPFQPGSTDEELDDYVRSLWPDVARCGYCTVWDGRPFALLPIAAPPDVVLVPLCANCVGQLDANFPDSHFIFELVAQEGSL